jgi:hypothetical protein
MDEGAAPGRLPQMRQQLAATGPMAAPTKINL